MRRTSSDVSMSSSIWNGGVGDWDSTSRRVAATSMAPVARFGLTLPPRERTVPWTAITPLGAQVAGEPVGGGVHLGIEDHLGEPLAVAQVDEDAAAVVAAAVDPAGDAHLAPRGRPSAGRPHHVSR